MSDPPIQGDAELNEDFLRSSVLIQYRPSAQTISFGSGFLVFRPIEGDKGHVFLVTNRHVIPPPTGPNTITIRVTVKKTDKFSTEEVPVVISEGGMYTSNVRVHSVADVAVINVTAPVVQSQVDAKWIPFNLLADATILTREEILPGDDIYLLGFPDAIYDSRNAFPLVRQGIIASHPKEGYSFNERQRSRFELPEHVDGFLIDAGVFPGSSGSAVILRPQAALVGSGGGTVVSNKKKIPYVLGIVSMSIPIEDTALGSIQRMGLGVVFSAETIRATIESFYP